MAKQRYVNTRLWRDSYIENLDPSEKLLFIYLLTNPDTNISGVYEIPVKIIAVDTGFDKEMIIKILNRFEKDGKVKFKDGWISIKNFTLHQNMNPKIKKGIITELDNAPDELVSFIQLNENIEYDRLSHLNTNTNLNSNLNLNLNSDESDIEPKEIASKDNPLLKRKKESFLSKDIDIPENIFCQDVCESWDRWHDYYTKIRKKKFYITTVKAQMKKLDNIANGDSKKAVEIIDLAIERAWLSFFEMKQNNNYNNNKPTGFQMPTVADGEAELIRMRKEGYNV